LASFLFAGEIKLYDNYEKAFEVAKQTKKDLMLLITDENCFFCVKMRDDVFKNATVIEYVNRYFVVADVNIYKRNYPYEKFKAVGPPTIFFIDKNEKIIGKRVSGFRYVEELIKEIEKVKGVRQ